MGIECRRVRELLPVLAFTVALYSTRAFSEDGDAWRQEADPLPDCGVVLEPCLGWAKFSDGAHGHAAGNYAADFSGAWPTFTVNARRTYGLWTRSIETPVAIERFPIAVLRYRSSEKSTFSSH